MPDASSLQESASGSQRIEVRHDLEAMYWCRLFDVSPQQLRHAVQQVGPQAAAVRRYFSEHHGGRWVEDSGF